MGVTLTPGIADERGDERGDERRGKATSARARWAPKGGPVALVRAHHRDDQRDDERDRGHTTRALLAPLRRCPQPPSPNACGLGAEVPKGGAAVIAGPTMPGRGTEANGTFTEAQSPRAPAWAVLR
jgi:hypothetical protein